MQHTLRQRLAALALTALAGPTLAGVVTFEGNLGDASNTALVAYDLGMADVTDGAAKANNVALHTLHVALAGTVSFESFGHAAGGIDPFFTLFNGTGPASATWLASNDANASTLGGDFTLHAVLAAGDYTVAIGAYQNLSFAENLGSGVLADGFIGLGEERYLGNGGYRITVTLPDTATPVPEPGGAALVLTAAFAALWAGRRQPRPGTL